MTLRDRYALIESRKNLISGGNVGARELFGEFTEKRLRIREKFQGPANLSEWISAVSPNE